MKTFTVYIYESGAAKPFTLDTNDPHVAYKKFTEAIDFLNPHTVRVYNNEIGRDVFLFDMSNYRARKSLTAAVEADMDRERKAQAVMRSCYSE